jgi:hypothetical protein
LLGVFGEQVLLFLAQEALAKALGFGVVRRLAAELAQRATQFQFLGLGFDVEQTRLPAEPTATRLDPAIPIGPRLRGLGGRVPKPLLWDGLCQA